MSVPIMNTANAILSGIEEATVTTVLTLIEGGVIDKFVNKDLRQTARFVLMEELKFTHLRSRKPLRRSRWRDVDRERSERSRHASLFRVGDEGEPKSN
jgi:hypothetical protein